MPVKIKKYFLFKKFFYKYFFAGNFIRKKYFLFKKKLIFTIKKFFQCDRRLLSAGTAKKQ